MCTAAFSNNNKSGVRPVNIVDQKRTLSRNFGKQISQGKSASIQKFLSRISEEARVISLREYSGFGWSILIDAVQMIHASQEDLLPSNRRGRVEAFIQFVRGNRLVVA